MPFPGRESLISISQRRPQSVEPVGIYELKALVVEVLKNALQGWNPPILGEPLPAINENAVRQFPLFPIALSDRVPFLLVKGYRSGGKGESAAAFLKLCEGLSLVREDYPASGYERAARDLTQMESFRRLYAERDMQEMVDIIMRQAKPAKAGDNSSTLRQDSSRQLTGRLS